MTRAKFVIITDDGIYNSTEFNGDGYYSCHGKDITIRLSRVANLADFERQVADFNDDTFKYDDEELVFKHSNDTDGIDFSSRDYFDEWFSDYLYIKNCRKVPVEIRLGDYRGKTAGPEYTLGPLDICSVHFGENLDGENPVNAKFLGR